MSTRDATVVRSAHKFDEVKLEKFCEQQVKGFVSPLVVKQFSHGQSNPTFLLQDGKNQLFVLRKKPPGKLLSSAHAVDREYRIISSLSKIGFPVAKPLTFCDDVSVIGTPFYIMEFVRGRIFRDPKLPELSPQERSAIYDELNRVLAKLHSIDWTKLGLQDYGRPGNYFQRQITTWTRQYTSSKTSEIEEMNRLIEWLPQNIPKDDETCIVHGDYRLENVIFHETEPKIIACLDWELSTLGHPLADFAYLCMMYHNAFTGIAGEPIEGIPREEDFVRLYGERRNRTITNWNFYLAFSFFRMAGIAQGVYARALQGNASAENAGSYGVVVEYFAKSGWEFVSSTQKPSSRL